MTNYRKQFDMLKNNKLIYFDNSASTLKPNAVVKACNNYNQNISANTGRGVYKTAYQATQVLQQTRQKVAQFINTVQDNIIFTKNSTDAINLVAFGFAKQILSAGDEILISKLEHHSNYLPWYEVAKAKKAKLRFVKLNSNHTITVENFEKNITKNTKIVALTYVSNVMGTVTPVAAIAKICKKHGIILVVDAAQAPNHLQIDVKKLGCDFLCFSGYKMYAPTGVGVLYAKARHIKKMQPQTFGGGMVYDVFKNKPTYKTGVEKFEAGTLDIAAIYGLSEAVDFINTIGYKNITEHDAKLKNYMLQELGKLDFVNVINPHADVAIISFNINNVHPHDAATFYDEKGICIRAGMHCAKPLLDYLCVPFCIRASLAIYNTTDEIDKFIEVTKQIYNYFN